MPSYIETMDVTKPAGSRDRSLGDDDIREYKRAMAERLDQDHVMPADETGYTTVGYHRKCTLVAQGSNPTNVAGTGIVFTKDAGAGAIEQFYIDAAGNVVQITNAGKLRAESLGGVYPAASLASIASIMAFVLPVGIVITLGVSTNPNTLFGVGTWTAIAGKVIVGIDGAQTEFDTLDETGGAKTHTLTTAEMPAHDHPVTLLTGGSGLGNGGNSNCSTGTTGSTGGGGAHNNLQPYIVKYVWQRTA